MPYTETELSQLISAVEKEFSAHLNLAKSENASATLAKSEDDKAPKKEDDKESSKEEAHEASSEEEHQPEEDEQKPSEHQESHEEGRLPAAQDHDYDDEDLEHLHKMYMSMGPGELKVHHDAIKKCLDSHCSMAKGEEVEKEHPGKLPGAVAPASKVDAEKAMGKAEEIEKQSPGKIPGAKSEASDAHGDKINVGLHKNENPRRGSGGQMEGSKPGKIPGAKSEASKAEGVQMEKSELSPEVELLKSQFEAEKAKTENLQKSLDAVSAFLTKFVEKTAPKGKAITSLDAIAKSEESNEVTSLSKSEITNILAKKAADPALLKTDREAINNYCLNNASVNSISHLLR